MGESEIPLWTPEGHLFGSFLGSWEVWGSKMGAQKGSWGTI